MSRRVDAVAEEVPGMPLVLRGDLDAWQKLDADLARSTAGLVPSADRVMVGQCEAVEPDRGRLGGDLGRCGGAVAVHRMGVQIETAHTAMLVTRTGGHFA